MLSIPLGVVLFVLFLVTLLLLQINDSFLDPDFYPEELRKNEVYEFVLVDLLTSAIDDRRAVEAGKSQDDIEDTPLLTSGLATEEIVSSINRAVPPEWVQELVEQAFDEFGNYITGRNDEFTFTLKAGDRVDTLVEEVKSLLRKADAYELLYERELIPRIEDAAVQELPLGLEVTSDRMVEVARAVVPPEWVQEQVEAILDEVTPYIKGDRETFLISVPLSGRVEIALSEIKQLLRETNAYDLLYDEVIAPQVTERLGDTVGGLPFGVAVTSDEVISALRDVAPAEWVQQQAERVIDDASPYLTGQVDDFATEISLEENKQQARRVLTDLIDRKLSEMVAGLPTCRTLEQARAAISGGPQSLPSCIPPNIDTDAVLDRLGIDVGAEVTRVVLAPIPDTITFSVSQLRTALELAGAGDNLEQVDEVRKIIKDGWTYTQEDLREDLMNEVDEEAVETLDDLRAFLADGWTYTRADFTEDISREGSEITVDDIDRGRDVLKMSRTYRWIIYVPMVLVLVVIGFLGGRGWLGRVKWAAAFLLASAAIIFVAFGPVYDALASSGWDEAREEALKEIATSDDYAATTRLAVNKGFDVVESVADGFTSGLARSSLYIAVIALVVLAAAILWSQIVGLLRRWT